MRCVMCARSIKASALLGLLVGPVCARRLRAAVRKAKRAQAVRVVRVEDGQQDWIS